MMLRELGEPQNEHDVCGTLVCLAVSFAAQMLSVTLLSFFFFKVLYEVAVICNFWATVISKAED